MSDTGSQQQLTTRAYRDLEENLEYARDLIRAGRHLERLQVRAFDVADLYRAAVVQTVSALDHWVHSEVYDRAVGLAVQTSVDRPGRFLKITIPMSLFEDVHHHAKTLEIGFREHLQNQFGYVSFQNPTKIKDAFGHVSDVSFWPGIAAELSKADDVVLSAEIQDGLREVVNRRNAIAHASDREPGGNGRRGMTEHTAAEAVDLVHRIARAALNVLGPSPYKEKRVPQPTKKRWPRSAVEEARSAMPAPIGTVLGRLIAHADTNQATFNGGTGAEPSAGFYYPTRVGRRSLWSLYATKARPSISLNIALVSGVDEAIARQFIDALRRIPAIDAALLDGDDALLRKYPTVHLDAIADTAGATDGLLRALDLVVEAWR